jgi:hypothetical protein
VEWIVGVSENFLLASFAAKRRWLFKGANRNTGKEEMISGSWKGQRDGGPG